MNRIVLIRLVLLLAIPLLKGGSYCYGQSPIISIDTLANVRIFFPADIYVVQNDYMSNSVSLSKLKLALSDSTFHPQIDSVAISTTSSPDGNINYNIDLSIKRARSIYEYLRSEYSFIDKSVFRINNSVADWNSILSEANSDKDLPNSEKVLSIVESNTDPEAIQLLLKRLDSGKTWGYIADNYLSKLRSGVIQITMFKKEEILLPVANEEPVMIVEETPVIIEEPTPEPVVFANVEPANPPQVKTDECDKHIVVKTNLAAYVFLVANAGVEIPINCKFSVDLPLYYSPYHVSDRYKFRLLAIQPEVRYWTDNVLKGHFFGANLTTGWFNIGCNKNDRYQDAGGNSPMFGVGLSYGYALRFGETSNWGMEFTFGLGYIHAKYDVFYNIHNGAKFDTRELNYWGPTKLGINLIYHFNKK